MSKPKISDERQGAISGYTTVRIPGTKEQMDELRAALAVVDRYKRKAMKAGNTVKENWADWTMVGYAVKTDCVEVKVEQGMAG